MPGFFQSLVAFTGELQAWPSQSCLVEGSWRELQQLVPRRPPTDTPIVGRL